MLGRPCELYLGIVPLPSRQSVLPEERSPQIAQMCLVKDAIFPEGWAGTLRTPLRPSGGLMSSLLLTGFMGELSCKRTSQDGSALGSWGCTLVSGGLPATPLYTASLTQATELRDSRTIILRTGFSSTHSPQRTPPSKLRPLQGTRDLT